MRLLRAIAQTQPAEIQPLSDWGTWTRHLKILKHQSPKGNTRASPTLLSLRAPGEPLMQLSCHSQSQQGNLIPDLGGLNFPHLFSPLKTVTF